MRVEDRRELGPEALADVLAHVVELAARLVRARAADRAAPARASPAGRVLDAREVERGPRAGRPGRSRSRRAVGAAAQRDVALLARRLRARAAACPARASSSTKRPRSSSLGRGDQVEQARVHHDRREQLRAGLEQLDVARQRSRRARTRLHHEHADRDAAHDERRRHQRREALLARLGEVAELRMLAGRARSRRRSPQLGGETDEPLAERQRARVRRIRMRGRWVAREREVLAARARSGRPSRRRHRVAWRRGRRRCAASRRDRGNGTTISATSASSVTAIAE